LEQSEGTSVAKRGVFVVVVAAVGLLALAPGVLARNAYVTNSGTGTVTVFDTASNVVFGAIPLGGEPVDVAIAPDGTRAFVANKGTDSVAVIDTATNAVLTTIGVGDEPRGIAVSPDGTRVYVGNFGDDTVSVIETASLSVVGAPIPVGDEPDGVAITPDGSGRVFVAQRGGNVSIIEPLANAVIGTVTDPFGPSRLAIGPNGGRGFVTDSATTSVTAFNPSNGNLVGAPIPVDPKPAGIAISPGGTAYVASPETGTVTPIDISTNSPLSGPIGGFPGATGVAVRPDGLVGYVTDGGGSTVTLLDTAGELAAGSIAAGTAPTAVAIVPNQGPRASFFVSPVRRRAKRALTFHGAGSTDPDGKVANYAWDFGDGKRVEGPQSRRRHRYRSPGEYLVTLAVTDDEGCGVQLVFTGQTASCNGSTAAVLSMPIVVGDPSGPILRLAGSKRQSIGPRVKVRARCPREPCAVRARGRLVTAVDVGGGETSRRVRRLRATPELRPSRSWRKLRLRLPPRARRAALRAILRGGRAKVKIEVLARDIDGERTLRQRTVDLVP
jgi:YVTN family beta-propeller protein